MNFLSGAFNTFKNYYSPPPLDPQIDQIFRSIEDVFYDFGLYSDKPGWFATYQLPVLPRSRPLIAGGWLKIQLNMASLPRGVILDDILNPTLLTALKSALDTNVEIAYEESAPLQFSAFSEDAFYSHKKRRGLLFWRSQTVPDPERYNLWIRVELSKAHLRGIPRFFSFDELPSPDPDHHLSWPIGVVHGDSAYFADFPTHIITMLVCGATRQGKSNYMRSSLKYVRKHYAPTYYQFIIADFKPDQTDFADFSGPDIVALNSVPDLLAYVDKLNRHNASLHRDSGTHNVFEHNQKADTVPSVPHIPYTIVVIDEMYL